MRRLEFRINMNSTLPLLIRKMSLLYVKNSKFELIVNNNFYFVEVVKTLTTLLLLRKQNYGHTPDLLSQELTLRRKDSLKFLKTNYFFLVIEL